MQRDVIRYLIFLCIGERYVVPATKADCPNDSGQLRVRAFVFQAAQKINGKSIALSFLCLDAISCRCLPATECERTRAPGPARVQFDLPTVNSFSLHSEKPLSPKAHSLR